MDPGRKEDEVMRHSEIEEEVEGNPTPLFSTNVLPQGKLTLPDGRQISCFTRASRHMDSSAQDFLFVDDLWPGCRFLADFIILNRDVFVSKICLELGAGGALPSLAAGLLGAEKVVITDYPAKGVIENIEGVIAANSITNAVAIGHIWGIDIEKVLKLGRTSSSGEMLGYDVIFLAELLWRDTYHLHRNLLESLSACMNKKTGVAYMTIAHRPTTSLLGHTAEKDLEFFSVAASEFDLKSSIIETCSRYFDVGELVTIDVYLYELRVIQKTLK